MLLKLANLLTKRTLLVIWQIQDGLSTSRNKSLGLVLKPCKSIQETSEEVLFIKAQQIARQIHFYRDLMMKFDNSSIEVVFIENYEIQISRSDFTYINVYLCWVSFLITLNIYKDYFKGNYKGCKVMQLNTKSLCMQIVTGDRICPSSSYYLQKLLCLCTKGFVIKGLLDLHCQMN